MGTRKSSKQNRFAKIPAPQIQRSNFNRSCGLKTSFDAGMLIPIFADEALPGDTMTMKATLMGRIATLLHPIMDNVYLDTFFFAVPMRLVWDNFEKFMGAQDNPDDSTDFLVPQVTSSSGGDGFAEGTVYDYFGLPTKVNSLSVNSLHLRAYSLIYNEWFRDQNLQDSIAVPVNDGPDSMSQFTLLPRGKRHDYFTSCLPWPQKGDAVTMGIGGTAPVSMDQAAWTVQADSNATPTFAIDGGTSTLGSNGTPSVVWDSSPASDDAQWNNPHLEIITSAITGTANLADATAATINEIRQAFQLQRLLERDARGGTRYAEIVRSHFGVVSPDQRLQRPEYLGGGTTALFTREVPNTAGITEVQAQLAAYGTVVNDKGGFRKSFTEHTLIIGMCCLRADLNYQQGLERMWSRQTKYDYYWPTLAHLGEQAVLNKEIFADASGADENVFGYQERFAEYRYKPSRVCGAFRSNAATTLDSWHLSQDFANLPVLDTAFIVENPPIARIAAVPSEPDLIMDVFFDFQCARPMPVYSVPGMIDHF